MSALRAHERNVNRGKAGGSRAAAAPSRQHGSEHVQQVVVPSLCIVNFGIRIHAKLLHGGTVHATRGDAAQRVPSAQRSARGTHGGGADTLQASGPSRALGGSHLALARRDTEHLGRRLDFLVQHCHLDTVAVEQDLLARHAARQPLVLCAAAVEGPLALQLLRVAARGCGACQRPHGCSRRHRCDTGVLSRTFLYSTLRRRLSASSCAFSRSAFCGGGRNMDWAARADESSSRGYSQSLALQCARDPHVLGRCRSTPSAVSSRLSTPACVTSPHARPEVPLHDDVA